VLSPNVTGVSPAEGPTGGATVATIGGTHLGSASKVDFGNREVPSIQFLAASESEIEVKAPEHTAGAVDITVTTPGGTSAISPADRYSYIAPPVVTSIGPSKGSADGGTTVSITGTRLEGASRVEFGSTEATIIEDTQSSIKATAPAHPAGAVHITVTTTGGTSGKFSTDEYTYMGPQALTVSLTGSGTGSVNCNSAPCASSYPYGSVISLSATPSAGSTFAGFSGDCSGTGCTVHVEGPLTVTATFDKRPEEGHREAPPATRCVVPRLKGKPVAAAKSALHSGHCGVGKVLRPKGSKGKLVVKSSNPSPGSVRPANTRVNLKLAPHSKGRNR
jgi:hypothetical protein